MVYINNCFARVFVTLYRYISMLTSVIPKLMLKLAISLAHAHILKRKMIFKVFHGDFWHSKNANVYFCVGGRWGGSQKVYGLYTHENDDIYGWPLRLLKNSIQYHVLVTTEGTTLYLLALSILKVVIMTGRTNPKW